MRRVILESLQVYELYEPDEPSECFSDFPSHVQEGIYERMMESLKKRGGYDGKSEEGRNEKV